MMKTRVMLWSTVAVLLVGCAANPSYKLAQTQSSVKTTTVTDRSIEYRILPQDRLEVSLYKDPAQSSDGMGSNELGQLMNRNGILVNAAGYISLPLIGTTKVAGLSQSQAARKITREYKKYLNTPSVYVEMMNKRLSICNHRQNCGTICYT